MANPFGITWTASTASTTLIANVARFQAGIPLPLQGLGTILSFSMPNGTFRRVRFTPPAVLATNPTTFVVTGRDQSGLFVSENVIVTQNVPINSVGSYDVIQSIVPVTTDMTHGMSVTYTNTGYSPIFLENTWKINSLVSMQIIASGVIAVTPQLTLYPMPLAVPTGRAGTQPSYTPVWLSMIAANFPNTIPSPAVIPIPGSCAATFPDFPFTALRLFVNNATTTVSFQAYILGQGEKD